MGVVGLKTQQNNKKRVGQTQNCPQLGKTSGTLSPVYGKKVGTKGRGFSLQTRVRGAYLMGLLGSLGPKMAMGSGDSVNESQE